MTGNVSDGENLEPQDAKGEAAEDSGQPPAQVGNPMAEPNPPPSPNGDTVSNKPYRDWFDYVKFAVEIVGLGVLIAYTVYAGLQWCEMRKAANAAKLSADVAQATLVASNRPWLDVKPLIISPLTFDGNGAHLTVQIETSDVGHSPAVRVSNSQEFIQVIGGNPNPWREIERLCGQAGGASALPSNRWVTQTVFPGVSDRQSWTLTIAPNEMRREIAGERMPYIYPVIVWCVAYQSDFSKVEHHTGYAWQIFRTNSTIPGGASLIDPTKGPVFPENLLILKYPFIGPLAD